MKIGKKEKVKFIDNPFLSGKLPIFRRGTTYIISDEPTYSSIEFYNVQRWLRRLIELSRCKGFEVVPALLLRKVIVQKRNKEKVNP